MNRAINLGKLFGIDLKINVTFLFLLIWVGFSSLLNGASPTDALSNVMFIIALFILIVLHEFGHALVAKRFGIKTHDITLLPIGGVAQLEKMPKDPKQELIVAIAGPAVNVLIAGILIIGLLITDSFSFPLTLTIQDNFWLRLLSANLTLAAFNLIPAFPMDGGRVLRSMLALKMAPLKATQIAANIGKGIAVIFAIAGFFINPWLILTAIFIWIGANSEFKSQEIQSSLEGSQVQDAMISKFYQVEANQPLDYVLHLSMQTGQHNIPVTSNGHFLGIIRPMDLFNAHQRLGKRAPVYAALGSKPESLSPLTPLKDILEKFKTNSVLPVIANGQLIGLVTPESIQQLIWLNQKTKISQPQNPGETRDTL